MQMCVLGSGSSGNSSVIQLSDQADGPCLMIDAGFGPKVIEQRLARRDIQMDQLSAILLTHLDRDHFHPTWLAQIARRRIALYCSKRHLHELYRLKPTTRQAITANVLHREKLLYAFDEQPFGLHLPNHPQMSVRITPLHLPHDQSGSTGYRIATAAATIGYATDLGHVPDKLIRLLTNSDLIAIESNYDHTMQINADRPPRLIDRVIGQRGHLSNDQAYDLLCQIAEKSDRPARHIALLHLSRQCNCPDLIRRLYTDHPALAQRIYPTTQDEPTDWFSAV